MCIENIELVKIIVMVLLPAVIASGIYINDKFVGNIVTMSLLNLALFSFGQVLIEHGKKPLFASLCEISSKRLAIYALTVLVFDAVIRLLKKKYCILELFISTMAGVFAGFILVVQLFATDGTNYYFFSGATISLFITLLIGKWYGLKDVEKLLCNRENLSHAGSISVFFALSYYFFMPNQIYITNSTDMALPYSKFLFISIICVLVIALITFFLFTVLPEKLYHLLMILYFGVLIAEYIQGNFLNGKLVELDGDVQNWSFSTMRNNLIVIVLIIMIIILILGYLLKRELTDKVIFIGGIWISAIMLLTVLWLAFSTDIKEDKSGLTTENIMQCAANDNTIVFILDRYDAQLFDIVTSENPDILNQMKDFTYYKDVVVPYAETKLAVPYLLSGGIKWDGEMDESEYMEYVCNNSTLIKDISDNGYRINMYSTINPNGKLAHLIDNYSENVDYSVRLYDFANTVSKVSRFTNMPFAFKNQYRYTHNNFNSMVSSNMYNYDNQYFSNMVFDNLLTVDNNLEKSFQIIHTSGAHDPYTIDKNGRTSRKEESLLTCCEGSIRMVIEYIGQLKDLGVYDMSNIYIIADHGYYWTRTRSNGKAASYGCTNNSNPILLEKKAGSNNESIVINDKVEETYDELIQSIAECCGIDEKYASEYNLETAIDKEHAKRYELFDKSELWEIDGNSRDFDNWTLVNDFTK